VKRGNIFAVGSLHHGLADVDHVGARDIGRLDPAA
jgi:hypothetical protein